MNAIHTRYLGPTDNRGARIVATADAPGGRLVISYPHEKNMGEDAHRVAAEALRDKLGWTGLLIGGYLPDGSYAFVFSPTPPLGGSDGDWATTRARIEEAWERSAHERHVDLQASCRLCVQEAGNQPDRLVWDGDMNKAHTMQDEHDYAKRMGWERWTTGSDGYIIDNDDDVPSLDTERQDVPTP